MLDTCIIHLSKPTEYTTPRVSPDANYGFWVICHCRLISYNKCGVCLLTLQEASLVWGGGHMENLCLFCSICCELKAAVKK